jgi:hypothetical protein
VLLGSLNEDFLGFVLLCSIISLEEIKGLVFLDGVFEFLEKLIVIFLISPCTINLGNKNFSCLVLFFFKN